MGFFYPFFLRNRDRGRKNRSAVMGGYLERKDAGIVMSGKIPFEMLLEYILR
jgi:hypothetical protein